MRRYEQYAPSGFDWLGDLPSHWSILRAKYVFKEIDDRSVAGDEELLSVSHLTGVTPRSEKNVTMFMAEDYTGAKLCKDGDLVINTMWAWMGALGVSSTTGIVSPAYGVYRQFQQPLRPRYMDWLFRTPMYVAEYTRRSTGVNSSRLRLYPDRFLDMPVVIPPLEEQDHIVTFLDEKISEIDAAIAKKERLTELLLEQQFNAINHVVTQGLDIDSPRQLSNEQWLESFPAHWQLMRIKHVLSAIVDTEHKTPPMYEEGPVLVVRTSNVKGGELTYANAKFTDEKTFSRWTRRATPEAGDILFTREAPAGEACVLPAGVKAIIGQRMVLFKVNAERLDPHFAVHSIYSGAAKVFVELLSVGSTVAHFNMSDIGNIPLLLPPLDEQRAISQKIREIQNQFKPVIASTASSLEQLRELKHVLIESVVSGQVAVPRE
jgi:type I restriction enzyme S subunit